MINNIIYLFHISLFGFAHSYAITYWLLLRTLTHAHKHSIITTHIGRYIL